MAAIDPLTSYKPKYKISYVLNPVYASTSNIVFVELRGGEPIQSIIPTEKVSAGEYGTITYSDPSTGKKIFDFEVKIKNFQKDADVIKNAENRTGVSAKEDDCFPPFWSCGMKCTCIMCILPCVTLLCICPILNCISDCNKENYYKKLAELASIERSKCIADLLKEGENLIEIHRVAQLSVGVTQQTLPLHRNYGPIIPQLQKFQSASPNLQSLPAASSSPRPEIVSPPGMIRDH